MLFWLWPLERHPLACMRSLRLVILSLLGAALLVLGAACGGGDDDAAQTNGSANPDIEVPADAVAVVAGTSIPRADYDRLFAQAEKAYEAQQREFPAAGTPEYEQLKNQTVEFLVDRAIREKEAEALGIEVTDQEVADRLTELKQQFFEGDEQKYQDELEAQGVTEEDVLADLRAQLISQKIFDQVTKDVTVTDDEVQKYYDDNEEQFTTPESREVAHILVDTNDKKPPTTSTSSSRTAPTSRSWRRSTRPTPPRPSTAESSPTSAAASCPSSRRSRSRSRPARSASP